MYLFSPDICFFRCCCSTHRCKMQRTAAYVTFDRYRNAAWQMQYIQFITVFSSYYFVSLKRVDELKASTWTERSIYLLWCAIKLPLCSLFVVFVFLFRLFWRHFLLAHPNWQRCFLRMKVIKLQSFFFRAQ